MTAVAGERSDRQRGLHPMTLAISLPYWAETTIKTVIVLAVIPASAL
ncbi:MAG: hypothetical protein JOZ04_08405, partial [Acidimicrobiia bacterium]|nr:hypothetical protein [Acidimicrobiia bacterium]